MFTSYFDKAVLIIGRDASLVTFPCPTASNRLDWRDKDTP
jgi:hypothetical protein